MPVQVTVEPDTTYDPEAVAQSVYRDGFPLEQTDAAGEVHRLPHQDYDVTLEIAPDALTLHYDDPPNAPADFEATVEQYLESMAEHGHSAISLDAMLDEAYDPYPELPDAWVEQFADAPEQQDYGGETEMHDVGPK